MLKTADRERDFRGFYFQHAGRLKSLALMLTGNPEQAADLTQEALLRAYRSWHRIRNEDPGPYVRRALVNLHRNQIRRKITERKHQSQPVDFVEERNPHVVEALRVAEALSALSPIRKAAVVLRYYEDLSEAEIARVLERPIGTIKSDLHRALKQLRPLLESTVEETR